jgi:glucitol operon activator protein
MTPLLLLAAVVGGTIIQQVLAYRQSQEFNRATRDLRKDGKVSVGRGGRRYRGGRAFVAIAVDDRGLVRNAISLQGWTTFARSRPLPALFGVKVSQLRGDRDLTGVTPQQREAARQAAGFLKSHRPAPA